jgi:hypothetical protein
MTAGDETLPRLEVIDRRFRGIVHGRRDGALWATRGRTVLRLRDGAQEWLPVVELPRAWPRDLLSGPRALERASRADQAVLYPLSSESAFVVRAGTMFVVDKQGVKTIGIIQGDCPLKSSIAVAGNGSLLFGEYFQNRARRPVHIWRVVPEAGNAEIAWTFPAGRIRHVHGVFRDSQDDGVVWVTTGDENGECYLWRSDDDLQTLTPVGDGSQSCRVVTPFFTPTHLVWFTDSHSEQNYRMTLDRRTLKLERHEPMESSVWYGTVTTDGMFFAATAVEQGAGVQTEYATILFSSDGFRWRALRRFRKDPWRPRGIFKFGVISFATGCAAKDELWISGEALWHLDGRSAVCRLIS